MKRNWYEIKAQAEGAEIYLYDEIGGWGVSVKDFLGELKAVSGKPLSLHIHSPGGSVLDGHAIYNALLRHKGGVTVQIDGLAASMASVIAMAGQTVRMAENAFLMIHNPWSVAIGESEDMRKTADILDKMRDGIVNIYAQKSGKDEDVIEEMMDAETWLTAEEAKEMGFIDEVTDRLEMAAKFDLHKFGKVPSVLAKVDTRAEDMSEPNLQEIQARHAEAVELAKQHFAALTLANAERDTLKASLQSLSDQLAEVTLTRDNAVSELATFQAAETGKINAEAARVVAAAGIPALNIGAEETGAAASSQSTRDKYESATDPKERALLRMQLVAEAKKLPSK